MNWPSLSLLERKPGKGLTMNESLRWIALAAIVVAVGQCDARMYRHSDEAKTCVVEVERD